MSEAIDEFNTPQGYVVETLGDFVHLLDELRKKLGDDIKVKHLNELSLIYDRNCVIKLVSEADISSLDYEEGVDEPQLIGITQEKEA